MAATNDATPAEPSRHSTSSAGVAIPVSATRVKTAGERSPAALAIDASARGSVTAGSSSSFS
jgi:hypothetical protein